MANKICPVTAGDDLGKSTKSFGNFYGSGFVGFEVVSFETGMVEWEAALSNEEIHRFICGTGKTFKLQTVELRQKGGGTPSKFSVDVYDLSNTTQLDTANCGSKEVTGAESSSAATIQVRITNLSGGTLNGSVIVRGYIS